jgi:hypothetical protein
MHRDYLYWMSLLNPADLATMIALAAVMLLFNRDKEATLRDAFNVMLAVGVPVAAWLTFSKGIGWPPLVSYTGLYVICGVVLATSEAFGTVAAVVGAAVLVVANVGCTELMK